MEIILRVAGWLRLQIKFVLTAYFRDKWSIRRTKWSETHSVYFHYYLDVHCFPAQIAPPLFRDIDFWRAWTIRARRSRFVLVIDKKRSSIMARFQICQTIAWSLPLIRLQIFILFCGDETSSDKESFVSSCVKEFLGSWVLI